MDKEGIRNMLETIFSPINMREFIDSIHTNMGQATLLDSVKSISEVLVMIGSYLMLLYFIKNMVEDFSLDKMTPQTIFAALIKMAMALAMIQFAVENFTKMFELDTVFSSLILTPTAGADGLSKVDKMMETYESYGKMDLMGVWAQLIIPYVAAWVLGIYIRFILYTRHLMLILRIIFSPIAMAGITEGLNGSSMNYIKKFLALLIQIIVIQGIMVLVGYVSITIGAESAEFTSMVSQQIIVLVVAAGMIGQSLRLSEELVGAR